MKTKFSKIKEIIEENKHLTNKELAKKVGRSISWIKAFKAFMNAPDKEKYKNSKNGIYRAIYNAWKEDVEAQLEVKCCEENYKLKKELSVKNKTLSKYKTQLREYEELLMQLDQEKKDLTNTLEYKVQELAQSICNKKIEILEKQKKKLDDLLKELEEENDDLVKELYTKKASLYFVGFFSGAILSVIVYFLLK